MLAVALESRGGRTIIASQESRAPLLTQRAVYPYTSEPRMARVCMMSSSGGVVQGDRYSTRISLGDGACARVVSQGATRIYGMDRGMAAHSIEVSVGERAYLELMPGQLIPYAHSRYEQGMSIVAHETATVMCTEIITPGRVAMGESFMYETCVLSIIARGEDARVRLADVSRLEPARRGMHGTGVLGGRTVAGSVYILSGAECARAMCEGIAAMRARDGVSCAASPLRGGDGLTVRMLADSVAPMTSEMARMAAMLREIVQHARAS